MRFAFPGVSLYFDGSVRMAKRMHFRSFPRVLAAILLFAGVRSVRAQEPGANAEQRNPNVAVEAMAFFHPDTAKGLVCVTYRINPAFFTFVRGRSSLGFEEYQARGLLIMELQDAAGATVSSESRPIELNRTTPVRDGEVLQDVEGLATFAVAPAEYRLVVELKDTESGRSFLNREQTIRVPMRRGGRLQMTRPVFVAEPGAPTDTMPVQYVPLNRGGRVVIGTPGGCLFEYSSFLPRTARITWEIETEKADRYSERQKFSGTAGQGARGLIQPSERDGRPCLVAEPDSTNSALYLPLPLAELQPGMFTLTVRIDSGAASAENRIRFEVYWPNRPLSLGDFALAVEALRHIAPKEEFDGLSALSTERGLERFRTFWKKRSPDTTRAFNPVMAEYYRRVDEAIKRYSTRDAADGYKSDRGRILILFGSPSHVERLLKPGSVPTELWTYDRLRKLFIFSDPDRNGTYNLTRVENL